SRFALGPTIFSTFAPSNTLQSSTSASHTLFATRLGATTNAGNTSSPSNCRFMSANSVAEVLPVPGDANMLQRGRRVIISIMGTWQGRGVKSHISIYYLVHVLAGVRHQNRLAVVAQPGDLSFLLLAQTAVRCLALHDYQLAFGEETPQVGRSGAALIRDLAEHAPVLCDLAAQIVLDVVLTPPHCLRPLPT